MRNYYLRLEKLAVELWTESIAIGVLLDGLILLYLAYRHGACVRGVIDGVLRGWRGLMSLFFRSE